MQKKEPPRAFCPGRGIGCRRAGRYIWPFPAALPARPASDRRGSSLRRRERLLRGKSLRPPGKKRRGRAPLYLSRRGNTLGGGGYSGSPPGRRRNAPSGWRDGANSALNGYSKSAAAFPAADEAALAPVRAAGGGGDSRLQTWRRTGTFPRRRSARSKPEKGALWRGTLAVYPAPAGAFARQPAGCGGAIVLNAYSTKWRCPGGGCRRGFCG